MSIRKGPSSMIENPFFQSSRRETSGLSPSSSRREQSGLPQRNASPPPINRSNKPKNIFANALSNSVIALNKVHTKTSPTMEQLCYDKEEVEFKKPIESGSSGGSSSTWSVAVINGSSSSSSPSPMDKMSCLDILKDNELKVLFVDYLNKVKCSESIEFHEAVSDFKQSFGDGRTHPEGLTIKEGVEAIYDVFLDPNAPMLLNVDEVFIDTVKDAIKGDALVPLEITVFDEIDADVIKLLNLDQVPKFKMGKSFERLKNQRMKTTDSANYSCQKLAKFFGRRADSISMHEGRPEILNQLMFTTSQTFQTSYTSSDSISCLLFTLSWTNNYLSSRSFTLTTSLPPGEPALKIEREWGGALVEGFSSDYQGLSSAALSLARILWDECKYSNLELLQSAILSVMLSRHDEVAWNKVESYFGKKVRSIAFHCSEDRIVSLLSTMSKRLFSASDDSVKGFETESTAIVLALSLLRLRKVVDEISSNTINDKLSSDHSWSASSLQGYFCWMDKLWSVVCPRKGADTGLRYLEEQLGGILNAKSVFYFANGNVSVLVSGGQRDMAIHKFYDLLSKRTEITLV